MSNSIVDTNIKEESIDCPANIIVKSKCVAFEKYRLLDGVLQGSNGKTLSCVQDESKRKKNKRYLKAHTELQKEINVNVIVKCAKCKSGEMNLKDYKLHVSERCPKTLVLCPFCSTQVFRKHLNKHKKSCPMATVDCPLACDKEGGERKIKKNGVDQRKDFGEDFFFLKRVFESHHVKTECENALLICPNVSCKKRVLRRDMANHLAVECYYRLVDCPFAKHGCSQKSLIPSEMKRHEDSNLLHHLKLRMDHLEEKNDETVSRLHQEQEAFEQKFEKRLLRLERQNYRMKRKYRTIIRTLKGSKAELQRKETLLLDEKQQLEEKCSEWRSLYGQLKCQSNMNRMSLVSDDTSLSENTRSELMSSKHRELQNTVENNSDDSEIVIFDVSDQEGLDKEEIMNQCKVVKQGNLLKQGNKFHTWRKRFFVLMDDGCLYYYDMAKKTSNPLGQINTFEVTEAKAIHVSPKRPYG
ncbi:hypothetical protein RFI_08602 [Reticulomyxa filosa]|uniref:PH domain-containing protein n=1 Tax=Reticulomyxa filosa TaxID=46433 RepID=X6NS35_RETFI|nr:hypothetical protein RFI_08602 [Reticulomyxa filosa]|eukprot:ETO28529.1 hypothetical protein RFI_08602 [Reticulomyxa filosa]